MNKYQIMYNAKYWLNVNLECYEADCIETLFRDDFISLPTIKTLGKPFIAIYTLLSIYRSANRSVWCVFPNKEQAKSMYNLAKSSINTSIYKQEYNPRFYNNSICLNNRSYVQFVSVNDILPEKRMGIARKIVLINSDDIDKDFINDLHQSWWVMYGETETVA